MNLPLHPWRGLRPFKRHSLVLMVAGLVYILIGGGYAFTPSTPAREQALHIALTWTGGSFKIWGVVWVVTGLLSIISSRWPPISVTWGYFVLTGLAAGWAAFYAAGVIFADAPTSVYTQTLIFGLLAFMWWAIGGLANPDDLAHLRAENVGLKAVIDAHEQRAK